MDGRSSLIVDHHPHWHGGPSPPSRTFALGAAKVYILSPCSKPAQSMALGQTSNLGEQSGGFQERQSGPPTAGMGALCRSCRFEQGSRALSPFQTLHAWRNTRLDRGREGPMAGRGARDCYSRTSDRAAASVASRPAPRSLPVGAAATSGISDPAATISRAISGGVSMGSAFPSAQSCQPSE